MTQEKKQLTTYNSNSMPTTSDSLEAIKANFGIIQMAMDPKKGGVLINNVHFGVIPGTGDSKPTLLKPGADVICSLFHIAPAYTYQTTDLGNGHREYLVTCTMTDMVGQILGQGVGLSTTLESKHRYRKGAIVCPACSKSTVFKSKQDKGGGWFCWAKKGGCGARFGPNDPEIKNQPVDEKIENENPADCYNTCLKMAAKRAQVAAVLTVTGASAAFTQDLEDFRGDVIDIDSDDVPDEPGEPSEDELITQLAEKSGLTEQPDIALLGKFVRETAKTQKKQVKDIAAGCLEHFDSFSKAFGPWFKKNSEPKDKPESSKKDTGKPKSQEADPFALKEESTKQSAGSTSKADKAGNQQKPETPANTLLTAESVSADCFDIATKNGIDLEKAIKTFFPDKPRNELTIDEWLDFRADLVAATSV